MRQSLGWLLVALIVGSPTHADFKLKPGYSPSVGDRAYLFNGPKGSKYATVSCAITRYYYVDYEKGLAIKDFDGLRELDEKGHTIDVETCTPVLLLELEEFPAINEKVDIRDAWVVRILEGPHKGKKLYAPDYYIAQLVEVAPDDMPHSPGLLLKEARKAEREGDKIRALEKYRGVLTVGPDSEQAKIAEPRIKALSAEVNREAIEEKARRLMTLGKNLEKAGKAKASLEYYRQVVKEYPKTTHAPLASERIKALGGK